MDQPIPNTLIQSEYILITAQTLVTDENFTYNYNPI